MSGITRINWKSGAAAAFIAVIAAYAFSQILVSAHAAKYGDGPHDHGGQVCVLSLVAPSSQKALLGSAIIVVATTATWRFIHDAPRNAPVRIRVAAPRPRAPPSR